MNKLQGEGISGRRNMMALGPMIWGTVPLSILILAVRAD